MNNLLNISIDDVSPHPKSSVAVLENCHNMIKKFPDIKFSLFIPISYWRTQKPGTVTQHPLQIDLFKDFCDNIKNLSKDNFEICYHGLFHGIPGKSDNDEFQHLSYSEAENKFNLMFEVVERASLTDTFKKIFRPPAWRMSPESIKAARDCGFEILALSPKEYAKTIYQGEENNKNDVVYYNCNPPFDELSLFEKTEIVYHACEWDRNYFSSTMSDDLSDFINKNRKHIEFAFIEELV